VRKTAEVIGHKWSTLIVRDLLTGKKRYSELARSLTGISPKVLSERLQDLEHNRLVTRTVYRNGEVLYSDVFSTHYLPWADIYQYGPGTELQQLKSIWKKR
jgi:hypothetical protein